MRSFSRLARLLTRAAVPLLLLFCAGPAFADGHALLVGVDEYQNPDEITTLQAASADAKGMGKALQEAAGFPAANVHLLTSDGPEKPSKQNILKAAEELARHTKAGDTVFFLYSGHGIEMDGVTYLLPWDTQAKSEETLKQTALSTTELTRALSRISAKVLILAFDMCRNDPRDTSRGISKANTLGENTARDLVLVPARREGTGPTSTVTLFSCSTRQRSYEWRARGRGFFCYFLEEGLRNGAADRDGTVRIGNLVPYVEKAVYGAVQREQGREQLPHPVLNGPGVTEVILAANRPPSSGGETAVPPGADKDPKARFDAAMQRGYELLLAKRFDAAESKFEEALALQPKSARATHTLGYISDVFKKDYAAAERLYRKAMELDPKDPMPVNNLGLLVYSVKKDVAEAERLYRQAMELDPSLVLPVSNLAALYQYAKGDYAEAERLYRQAIELDPKNPLPINNVGFLCLTVKKDYAEAEKRFKQAIELDSTYVSPVTNLALFYQNVKQDYPEAERLYRKASELDPKDAGPVQGLATILYAVKKDYPEAERLYRKALELDAEFADPANALGILYLNAKKDPAESERWFRKAVELEPSRGIYHANLALCLIALNRKEDALKEAKAALACGYKGPHPAFQRLDLKPE